LLAVCQLCCGLAEAGMLARAVIAKASANVILRIMLFSVFAVLGQPLAADVLRMSPQVK
jgi:hypothetical protein